MYHRDMGKHNAPHIHALYGEHEAFFASSTGQVISGELPKRQTRLVRRWIEVRRSELLSNWEQALVKESLKWIDPL